MTIKEDKNSVPAFNQDFVGSSQDGEGSRGTSQEKVESQIATEFAGSSRERDARFSNIGIYIF